ncbi:restriction endonuclease subunit S [Rubritepida flocculans]|uniref:restriction endonuclease subunit S n=1 Tax=Rubritepida flocculans TaxID=182403 RepID=UPI000421ADC7|nr:hypothetical protein [Rubritepida flocculans]
MSFPAYPAYRDSGVPWLAEVPGHWAVRRLRFLAEIRPSGVDKHSLEGELPVRLCNYVDVYKNDRITEALAFLEATATPAEIERFSLRPGDVLITKDSETPNDIAAAALVEPSAAGVVCGYHLALLRPLPGGVGGAFLFWAFKAPGTQAQCSVRAQGITRFGLSSAAIGDVLLPLPPPAEQRAIAAFLDRECGKIDALVAEQERLIALLKEKRQAVISHAVTKGLDPTAPMKDSGVAWLGQVPAHWEVKRLKFLARVQTGVAKGRDLSGTDVIEVPYLRVANVQDGYLDLEDVATIQIARDELDRYGLQPGDVLMNEGGDFDKLGRGHVWHGAISPCIHQNHVFSVRPHSIEPEWLALITSADCGRFFFMSRSKQSTNLASISSSNLVELPLCIPPQPERSAILEAVSAETTKLDTLTTEAERAIALLKERRAALISAAVTGRIDVRGLVPAEEAKAA